MADENRWDGQCNNSRSSTTANVGKRVFYESFVQTKMTRSKPEFTPFLR